MSMPRERLTNRPAENPFQRFHEFFPGATIQKLERTSVPPEAMQFFEGRSELYIPFDSYKPENFDAFFVIHFPNGDITHVATQTKRYPSTGVEEREVYLLDTREGKEIGHGEIRYNEKSEDPYFKKKPFVGFTDTVGTFLGSSLSGFERGQGGFQRQGLGTRRLWVMNGLSQQFYRLPLHSDTQISEPARPLWKRLIEQKKVRVYKEGKHDRYVFLLRARP